MVFGTCARCNRGSSGKFDRVPSSRLLERLDTRNEFLIASHILSRNPDATDRRSRNALRSRDRPTRRQTRTRAGQWRAVRVASHVRAVPDPETPMLLQSCNDLMRALGADVGIPDL